MKRRKIRYAVTGMELGELHTEQKEDMYRLWEHLSDADLERFGLRRDPEDEQE